jgi:hypothetical protein
MIQSSALQLKLRLSKFKISSDTPAFSEINGMYLSNQFGSNYEQPIMFWSSLIHFAFAIYFYT